MDPKQLAYPLYSQIALVKSNVKGDRLAPLVNIEEITPGFSRLLEILGAFHICSKETTLQVRCEISSTFFEKSVIGGALQSYFCLWAAELFRNLKARGKVFLEMEGTHGATNTVGAQQVSRTREKEEDHCHGQDALSKWPPILPTSGKRQQKLRTS